MGNKRNVYKDAYVDNYKKFIILTTGSWTPDDEEELREEIKKIEEHAGLMAYVGAGMTIALIAILSVWIVHLVLEMF